MTNKAVFFSRCRPQDSDPIEIVLRERRVFIGYPACRPVNGELEKKRLRNHVMDLHCSDEEWVALRRDLGKNWRREFQKNRNFVRAIEPGAIALVPRPGRGVVYAGRVTSPFELLDDPPWGEEYLQLRRKQRLDVSDECSHLADVAQCITVDDFRPIPFASVPAWIRRSLFGRSTYGLVGPLESLGFDPYSALVKLLDNPRSAFPSWTDELDEIERRLVEAVGPNQFEHLCVALLQLEHPQESWVHIGGSGDGGVDGISTGPNGKVVGMLQCKWAYQGESLTIADSAAESCVRQVLASIIHPSEVTVPEGLEFWSRRRIAEILRKHANRLPLALSLRIAHVADRPPTTGQIPVDD